MLVIITVTPMLHFLFYCSSGKVGIASDSQLVSREFEPIQGFRCFLEQETYSYLYLNSEFYLSLLFNKHNFRNTRRNL